MIPYKCLRPANQCRTIGFILTLALFLMVTGCTAPVSNPGNTYARVPVKQRANKATSGKAPQPYKVYGKYYQPLAHARNFSQEGIASWYGEKFHGRKTSNGEIYDMYGISAAHKTLPFGTYVKVTNLTNQKSLVIRINDRGPFVNNRIIDLSYGAAKKLDVVGPGTAKVRIEALGKADGGKKSSPDSFTPVDFYSGNFTVQIGAFKVRENAQEQRNRLSQKFKNAHISEYDSIDGMFYRVRIGKSSSLAEAIKYEEELIKLGFKYAFVVAE